MYSQGRFEESELLLKQCLQAQQSELGEHCPDVMKTMLTLALVMEAQGRIEEALVLLKQRIELVQQGIDNPSTLKVMSMLTALYDRLKLSRNAHQVVLRNEGKHFT